MAKVNNRNGCCVDLNDNNCNYCPTLYIKWGGSENLKKYIHDWLKHEKALPSPALTIKCDKCNFVQSWEDIESLPATSIMAPCGKKIIEYNHIKDSEWRYVRYEKYEDLLKHNQVYIDENIDKLYDHIEWIQLNLSGLWSVTSHSTTDLTLSKFSYHTTFYFEHQHEAAVFKLQFATN